MHILFVLTSQEGDATLTLGGESRKLAKDDVIIVPAGEK